MFEYKMPCNSSLPLLADLLASFYPFKMAALIFVVMIEKNFFS